MGYSATRQGAVFGNNAWLSIATSGVCWDKCRRSMVEDGPVSCQQVQR
jgi:hypothetical protein